MPRPALHAKSLGFIHPVSGKAMFFDSEIATDMQTVIDKWRNYIANR
jgi:23S rRNA pseudouridine1911/1915/1917 synthase